MGWLTPDETRQSLGRHPGSLDEIAMAAMGNPRYAAEFVWLGAKVETYEEQGPFDVPRANRDPLSAQEFSGLFVPEDAEQEFAKLIVAAAIEVETQAAVLPQPVAKRRVREPDRLETGIVTACEAKLRERAAVLSADECVPHELTSKGSARPSASAASASDT